MAWSSDACSTSTSQSRSCTELQQLHLCVHINVVPQPLCYDLHHLPLSTPLLILIVLRSCECDPPAKNDLGLQPFPVLGVFSSTLRAHVALELGKEAIPSTNVGSNQCQSLVEDGHSLWGVFRRQTMHRNASRGLEIRGW